MRIALMLIALSLTTACGFVSQNLKDGYQPGDITAGLQDDRAWYCGDGLMGIRAAARFALRSVGVPVLDVCKVIDVIVDSEVAPSASGSGSAQN